MTRGLHKPAWQRPMPARVRRLTPSRLRAPGVRPEVSPEDAALYVQVQVWGLKVMARMRPDKAAGKVVVRQTLTALFTDEAVASLEA